MSSFLSKGIASSAKVNAIRLPINVSEVSSLPKKAASIIRGKSIQITSNSLQKTLSKCSKDSVQTGIGSQMIVRYAHTDVSNVPSFDAYRHDKTKNPKAKSGDSSLERRVYLYSMMFAGAVMTTTAAKHAVKTLVMTLGPTAKTLAESSTEVNLATIPEGKNVVVKWRNKPLFVRHRTAAEIARERAVSVSDLRDPQRDEDRVKEDKWLICLGVCTHLGCVPIANSGDFGGYYCPCHGSHYDASGRIRKGPAPLNLEVPDYEFLGDGTVVVG